MGSKLVDHSSSFLILLILFIITINNVSGNIQTMQLKAENGETEIIIRNVRDLSKVSKLIKKGEAIQEFCTLQGYSTWVFFKDINYNEDNENAEPEIDAIISGNTCKKNYPIKSVRHIGNVETYKSALSLYTDIYYHGKELYFDGNFLKLPEHVNIKSYGFTGDDRWEIHPSNSQNTRTKCLERDLDAHLGIPYELPESNYEMDIEVSSIYRGCPSVPRDPRLHPQDPPQKDARRKTLPELRLYTGKDKQGAEFYMDGFELRLPRTFNFSSFKINGYWQVFTGRDFDGDSHCLSIYEKDNFSKQNGTIEVGSIKLGCGHIVVNDGSDDDDDDKSSSGVPTNLNLIAEKGFTFLLSILLCNYLAYLLK